VAKRYWLKVGSADWREVNEEQFIKAERDAGFCPRDGDGLATGGFSTTIGGGICGRITRGEIDRREYKDDPEFLKALDNSWFD